MKIRTRRRLIVERFDGDEMVEVEARIPQGQGRYVIVDVPEGTEHRCWYFDLLGASAKEREELRLRGLIKEEKKNA